MFWTFSVDVEGKFLNSDGVYCILLLPTIFQIPIFQSRLPTTYIGKILLLHALRWIMPFFDTFISPSPPCFSDGVLQLNIRFFWANIEFGERRGGLLHLFNWGKLQHRSHNFWQRLCMQVELIVGTAWWRRRDKF
jgi:hypothetical protein